MTTPKRVLPTAVLFVSAILVSGCTALPGGTVSNAATVVYTSGASQHTAAVQLNVPAAEIFEALVRVVEEHPDVEIVDQHDKAFLIEVAQGNERRFTGQVTSLGSNNALLYVWADAGSSGQSGRSMAISAVEIICDELGVDYEMVQY